MIYSRLAKIFVVYYIIISSASFYTLRYFPESFRNMMSMAAIALIILILIIDLFPDSTPRMRKYFTTEVSLFLVATFASMFIAKSHHYQDFGTTLLVQRFMYFYLFYFALHSLRLDADAIERVVLPLGLLYAGFYIFQYMAYPARFFESRIDVDRGTVRVFLPGAGFLMLAYFKSLQEFLTRNKYKYLIIALVIFAVGGILSGTRQSLASLTLITLAFVFFNREVKSRLFIVFIGALAGAALVALFWDIFQEMIQVTQQETGKPRPNVRLMAARYFTDDFMPSKAAYIFGNGQDSMNSPYGQRVNLIKLIKGFYQSDVGIIGDYSKFGIFFVIGQLSIMARIIFGNLHPRISYIRYYFISLALVMFSGANIFGRADGIAFICVMLYLVDYYKNDPSVRPRKDMPEGTAIAEPG
ncbi:MAG: hypothetical protein R6U64_02765 [Bacteroidales bacterium]